MKTAETVTAHCFLLGLVVRRVREAANGQPFEGYACAGNMGLGVTEDIRFAIRFQATADLRNDSIYDPWYKVEKRYWIEVIETLEIKRTVLS